MLQLSKGSSRADWQTPDWVLDLVRRVIGGPIELDPATTPDNPAKALRFYTQPDNGLSKPWEADSIFLNPPWSRKQGLDIEPWLQRMHAAAFERWCDASSPYHYFVVTTAAVNSSWWHKWLSRADRHFFPKGRIVFVEPGGPRRKNPSFDSAVTYFGTGGARFEEIFSPCGRVLR